MGEYLLVAERWLPYAMVWWLILGLYGYWSPGCFLPAVLGLPGYFFFKVGILLWGLFLAEIILYLGSKSEIGISIDSWYL